MGYQQRRGTLEPDIFLSQSPETTVFYKPELACWENYSMEDNRGIYVREAICTQQNKPSPSNYYIYILISRTYKYVALCGKRDFGDVIKLRVLK